VFSCSKRVSDGSRPHARSPSKHVKGFILSEVNSELEQIRGPNPVQQKNKNKNKILNGVCMGV
jgi:hypothetical protein